MKLASFLSSLFLLLFQCVSAQQNEPHENYFSNYFSLLNNVGDLSFSINDRLCFKQELLSQYFIENESVLLNNLTGDGSQYFNTEEYLKLN